MVWGVCVLAAETVQIHHPTPPSQKTLALFMTAKYLRPLFDVINMENSMVSWLFCQRNPLKLLIPIASIVY